MKALLICALTIIPAVAVGWNAYRNGDLKSFFVGVALGCGIFAYLFTLFAIGYLWK